jgi:hypothetical protein
MTDEVKSPPVSRAPQGGIPTVNWKFDATVQAAAAEVQTAIMQCKQGKMHYPSAALDALCEAVADHATPPPSPLDERETCQQYTEYWLLNRATSVHRVTAEVVRDMAANYDLYLSALEYGTNKAQAVPLAAPRETRGEPTAWAVRDKFGKVIGVEENPHRADDMMLAFCLNIQNHSRTPVEVVPLYLHPRSPSEDQR